MLEIKDWVLLPDGCSILSTVGMRRFQVLSRGEKDGYDTAQVKFLADVPIHHQTLKGKMGFSVRMNRMEFLNFKIGTGGKYIILKYFSVKIKKKTQNTF